MLRSLVLGLALSVVPATARAGCHDDPVTIELGPDDEATGAALRTLLGEDEGAPGWRLSIEGARSEVSHRASGERYARTLPAESSAYERALAALELLGAARAACTDRSEPAPRPEPPPPPIAIASPVSLTFAAGGRFDAEVDGPWLVRPALAVELGFARDGDAPYPLVGLEAAALGVFSRAARDQELAVRYERHDAALRLGAGLPLDRLTLLVAASVGVTIRDVTGLDEGVPAAHRLDVGATVGADAQLRIALAGPLGLRVGAGLVVAPETFSYRAAGSPVVTEESVRLAATVALDLEVR